jgi:hypothetical protein
MSTQQIQINEEQAREAARLSEILAADYSAATSLDELYGTNLRTSDIKKLYEQNTTFRAKVDEFNVSEGRAKLIADFRALNEQDQQKAYAVMTPENKKVIDEDYEAFIAASSNPPEATPNPSVETPEQKAEKERLAAEALVAEEAARIAAAAPVEELYDGIEKLSEGSYKLTVDPGDGTPAEIFYGASQKECFKALRISKANATKELRRRAKKVQITDELRALAVEVVNYPPPIKPLILSPDETFTLTEQLKDPTTVLEATRKLRQASLTPEECARQNEEIERRRFSDGYNTAVSWMQIRPEFYNCAENIEALQKLMAELNWAVTVKNLDIAFATLTEQGVLLERPEEIPQHVPSTAQPASVVPVAAAPAPPAASAPSTAAAPNNPPAAPAAQPSALPGPAKVLRPGSSSTAAMPTRRIESVPGPAVYVLTVEEYNRLSAAEAKRRYRTDPEFRKGFDALVAAGKI